MYQRGVMMLEILFVIVVSALLITIGVRLYQSYQHDTTRRLVDQDLRDIQAALVVYYQSIPCDQHGQWQGMINSNIIDQLALDPNIKNREPMISNYEAYIRETNQVTKQNQPIYQLEVRAKLTPYYQNHIQWLQAYFNATDHTSKSLVWRGLPKLFKSDQSSDFWVMDVSRALFQKVQTKPETGIALSHAYCAE